MNINMLVRRENPSYDRRGTMHRAPTSLVQKYLLHGVALGKEIGGMGLKNSFREEVQTWADISLDCPERGHARKFKKGHLHFFLKSSFLNHPAQ
jgi:hypothetical protein